MSPTENSPVSSPPKNPPSPVLTSKGTTSTIPPLPLQSLESESSSQTRNWPQPGINSRQSNTEPQTPKYFHCQPQSWKKTVMEWREEHLKQLRKQWSPRRAATLLTCV